MSDAAESVEWTVKASKAERSATARAAKEGGDVELDDSTKETLSNCAKVCSQVETEGLKLVRKARDSKISLLSFELH